MSQMWVITASECCFDVPWGRLKFQYPEAKGSPFLATKGNSQWCLEFFFGL